MQQSRSSDNRVVIEGQASKDYQNLQSFGMQTNESKQDIDTTQHLLKQDDSQVFIRDQMAESHRNFDLTQAPNTQMSQRVDDTKIKIVPRNEKGEPKKLSMLKDFVENNQSIKRIRNFGQNDVKPVTESISPMNKHYFRRSNKCYDDENSEEDEGGDNHGHKHDDSK